MDIKIIVATHKKYNIPEEEMYLPIFCGAENKEETFGYQKDNEGDNISSKNPIYCELTGLYWAWKNLDAEYLGLNHYRRYFKYQGHILKQEEAEKLLEENSVILTKKRDYYIEDVETQYKEAHGEESINLVRLILARYYPEYSDTFEKNMKKTSLHITNMFLMRKDICDGYCEFLFDVLQKVEQEMVCENRILGYLGERLFDTYFDKNQISYIELPVYHTEKTNWFKKIAKFLERKFNYEH